MLVFSLFRHSPAIRKAMFSINRVTNQNLYSLK